MDGGWASGDLSVTDSNHAARPFLMNDGLRLRCFRDCFLPRRRLSVPAARNFAGKALGDWGFGDRVEDVTLCVSEPATNALVHGVPPGRGFRVLVWLGHDGLCRFEVHDSGPGWPQIPEVEHGKGELEAGGRGLRLVAELADSGVRNAGTPERSCGSSGTCHLLVTDLSNE